jgi:hypothetical protein
MPSGAPTGEFAEAGCDELILFPCSPDLDQVDRLAEVGAALTPDPAWVRIRRSSAA